MLHAPLEQFEILQLIKITIFSLDFSITNFLLVNLLALLSFISIIYFNSARESVELTQNVSIQKDSLFFVIPNS